MIAIVPFANWFIASTMWLGELFCVWRSDPLCAPTARSLRRQSVASWRPRSRWLGGVASMCLLPPPSAQVLICARTSRRVSRRQVATCCFFFFFLRRRTLRTGCQGGLAITRGIRLGHALGNVSPIQQWRYSTNILSASVQSLGCHLSFWLTPDLENDCRCALASSKALWMAGHAWPSNLKALQNPTEVPGSLRRQIQGGRRRPVTYRLGVLDGASR